mmetsp:Transcript_17639/g.31832  ORF Transcript_17639/g.31832 Transcript_17639/m.31832 type:complete len:291 (+) Transcript_17639:911-1783(+)
MVVFVSELVQRTSISESNGLQSAAAMKTKKQMKQMESDPEIIWVPRNFRELLPIKCNILGSMAEEEEKGSFWERCRRRKRDWKRAIGSSISCWFWLHGSGWDDGGGGCALEFIDVTVRKGQLSMVLMPSDHASTRLRNACLKDMMGVHKTGGLGSAFCLDDVDVDDDDVSRSSQGTKVFYQFLCEERCKHGMQVLARLWIYRNWSPCPPTPVRFIRMMVICRMSLTTSGNVQNVQERANIWLMCLSNLGERSKRKVQDNQEHAKGWFLIRFFDATGSVGCDTLMPWGSLI